MFKILLIVLGIFFAQTASAQKNPQTLEEINADLIAKKAAMDPFHKKEIKVDLESLGLDDLDKKALLERQLKQMQDLKIELF